MVLYLNGEIVDEREALIPVWDRGVLFGDGLFETVRAYDGKPFRMSRHLERLRRGCAELRITGIPADGEIEAAVSDLYRTNVGEGDAYIRITLTGGTYDGGKTLARPADPNVFIVVQPYGGYPERFYRQGMCLTVSSLRRNPDSPLSRVKSNNYLDTLVAKQEASDCGADDAVVLNSDGYLAEGTSSNLFLVMGESLATPAADCGLLPGITREVVMELCDNLRLPCVTGYFTLEDLLDCDEAFLTVSTGEIVPVASVDRETIGEICPGAVTLRLHRAYGDLVKVELGLP
ncbi:MAG: aminotransferase class IV [Actinomycetota bacterium]|nr:aminotransferase class IV [Actinomycetota bacterium]